MRSLPATQQEGKSENRSTKLETDGEAVFLFGFRHSDFEFFIENGLPYEGEVLLVASCFFSRLSVCKSLKCSMPDAFGK